MNPFLASPVRNLLGGVIFLLAVSVAAVVAYVSQGWSWGDAAYMVVLTIYTVGYGEVAPVDTAPLRTITVLLILAGCTGMMFLTGVLVQLIAASQLQQFIGNRRMQKEIDKLSGHVVICGFGRIGQMLARELKAARCDFVVVEHMEERLNVAASLDFLSLKGNATDEEVLKQAGVTRARALATVLPDDAANVFITLSARSLNRDLTIIARGELPSTENKLIQAGADRVVQPARIGAERMAELLRFKDVTTLLSSSQGNNLERLAEDLQRLGLDIEVVAVEAGSRSVGATIAEVEALGAGTFLVVAMERRNGETLLQPHNEIVVNEGDGLAVVGRPGRARAMDKLFRARSTQDATVD